MVGADTNDLLNLIQKYLLIPFTISSSILRDPVVRGVQPETHSVRARARAIRIFGDVPKNGMSESAQANKNRLGVCHA